MKKLFLLLSFLIVSISMVVAQDDYMDVIYLKNGNVVKGFVVEKMDNVGVKINTVDGQTQVYAMRDIDRMTTQRLKSEPNYNTEGYYPYKRKSPGLAFVCSLVVPGLGQIVVNKEYVKGLSMMAGCALSAALMCMDNNEALEFGAVSFVTIYMLSLIDAPVVAKYMNHKASLVGVRIGKGYLGLDACLVSNSKLNPKSSMISSNINDQGPGLKLSFKF